MLLTSGSLSCSQSIVTLLRKDFDAGDGPGRRRDDVRRRPRRRRAGPPRRRRSTASALEHDEYKFNVHILLAGQIRGQPHDLYMIYPQGNPLRATEDSPFLQIGECKYGRPILDRGIRYDRTSLEDAARYALISLDSTMRSNVTVGPPIDLLVYGRDELRIIRRRRFAAGTPTSGHPRPVGAGAAAGRAGAAAGALRRPGGAAPVGRPGRRRRAHT